MSIIEFRAINPATGEVDGDLYDVAPLRDAFERFASGVTLKFIDEDGTKQSEYPYGRRVEVQYNTDAEGGGTWQTLGAFLTLEPSTTTNDGFPMVEVDGVGYTHLLTRDNPVTDYTDTAKSAILEDLITTFTPVRWDSAKVELVDDSAIDASIRGETPAEIISQIVSQSANEEWFVDRSLTFVVRPQDVESAPAVADTQIIDHDLPEKGARSINKMTIYYGANEDQAWVEEDREAQKELQEELDAPRPVEVADSDSFPEITTESEAKAKARKRLGDQSVIQTGTITTPLGFFGTAAGDVFTLSLDDAGIDSEDFRVAQHDYEWSKGTATRTIAENTGGNVDELLVSLSESLTNERLKSADPDAAVTNALRIGTLAEANLSLTVQTKTYGDAFLLAPDDDLSAFETHVLALVQDAALRVRIGAGGRALFDEVFAWPRIADRMLTALDAVPAPSSPLATAAR